MTAPHGWPITETEIKSLGKQFFDELLDDWKQATSPQPAMAVDAQGNPIDTPPTLVSATELLAGGAGDMPSIESKGAKPSAEANRDSKLPTKVSVTTDWGTLNAVMVGRADNDVLPAWYPSFTDPDGNEVAGPETAGRTKEQFDPAMAKLAIEQTEALCVLLEKEGVQVFRPPLLPPEMAQADPVGLSAAWVREVFTVIGGKLIVGQMRAAHRNKEVSALEPFLQVLEGKGLAQICRLPYCTFERNDNLEQDPRPFLEGGDIFRLGRDVLVTMSYLASSPTGYRWLADLLEPDGVDVWPAYLDEDFEHGDYVFFVVRKGLCVAYLKGFKDGLLPSPVTDWDVVEVTRSEADEGFAANGLVLRENVILLPEGNQRVVRALEKKGVDVIEVPFDGPIYWQGGIDCATAELWREG